MRRRLDAELVRRGLAPTRSRARELVESGRVRVAGAPASKPARLVDAGEPVVVEGDPPRWVGRGAEKLDAALAEFGPPVEGIRALDAGASTGGFTDCLLQHGAARVVALDVGHGQLHERLRDDPRVEVRERVNLRHVDPAALGPFDAVVADLSFISLTVVMEVLVQCTRPGGWLVLLVKPQFEAGRQEVSRGRGVVRDPATWRRTLGEVAASLTAHGAHVEGAIVSPLRGGGGNTEFLLHARRTDRPVAPPERLLDDAVAGAAGQDGGQGSAGQDGSAGRDGGVVPDGAVTEAAP